MPVLCWPRSKEPAQTRLWLQPWQGSGAVLPVLVSGFVSVISCPRGPCGHLLWGAGSQCANPALWNLPAWALFSALLPREHQEWGKNLQGCHLLKHFFLSFFFFLSPLLCYKIKALTWIFKTADNLGHERASLASSAEAPAK